MMPTVAEKRELFAELHTGPGIFVMPNPWDVGSTIYLASLGFKALATTSRGMAFAAGKPDGGVMRAYALRHIGELVAATSLPVNADFEAGFAANADALYESAKLCIGTGVAGFSIEDFTGDARAPFYAIAEAADRIRAARAAINASGQRVLLTARSEVVLHGHPGGLAEALTRPTCSMLRA
jgi:2-methylisocitrate lyase-like PEP mutase family enzyme